MVNSCLALTIGWALVGCSVDSSPPEKQTSEEMIKKESTQEPKIELTGQPLTFKTDMEELEEMVVPDYTLERIDKTYKGNEEVGGLIHEDETTTSVSYGEIGDKPVSLDEEQAVVIAKEWIETAFEGFDVDLLKNREPIVAGMRNTVLGEEPEETIIGYSVQYPNEYGDIKIQYEGISVMLDDSGILFGSVKWSEFNKIETPENKDNTQNVDFKQSEVLLANAITKKDKELGLDENSEDARLVNAVELVFTVNEKEEYIPAWYYEMGDGRTYYVNCIDGQVNSL